MTTVLILGLVMNAIALPFAGRRVWWLYRLITSGQPAPDRTENVTKRTGEVLKSQLVEVLGQKKLLKWSVPGAAHFFVFWAFLILATVYLEAYGALFDPNFAIPLVGTWPILGFAQDFIAGMALLSLAVFAWIRIKNSPKKLGRKSRFKGSHLGGAWLVLIMIVNVVWTMFLFRGAASATGHLPYESGAFISIGVGNILDGLSHGAVEFLEHVGLLLHIGVMLAFLIIVLNSKHLHIFVAPLNVMFGRRPVALGAMTQMKSGGKPVTLDDLEDLDEDTTLGIGNIEDFSWKGMLDFASCTECGRCQSQCPAWNTEKPLSPKLLIMGLRDHAFHKAPYLLEGDEEKRAAMSGDVLTEVERPLVGETEGYAWEPTGGAVIDNDVLWSCTSCGACVEQCPVDIEHVDHIMDMRRYQVLVESNFPAELNQLFRGLENKGNPWNMSATARMDWAKDLPFEVKEVGKDIADLESVDWLFWVGCAGAYEDRAKKTTRAVAELLDMAGVTFGVLGNGETCTGDPARRAGNEFVYQGLAQQNVETFQEFKVKKVVSTCAHCFNTLKNEYKDLGIELEVVHHTQLLNRLVREGKLTPVKEGAGAAKRSITYHDPCYLGRHNQVYSPPRELLEILPGAEYVEMERNSEKSFCCGAGGARMWMEETIGERINVNRTKEAVGTGADQIAVGCPFCRVMLADGLTEEQSSGNAREEVEVLDVAQMLLASVKGESATRARPAAKVGAAAGAGAAAAAAAGVATKDEPEAGDVTITEDTVTDTADVGPAAKASGGSSLFDTPADEKPAEAKPTGTSGGSLFDTPADEKPAEAKPTGTSGGSSLFDTPAAEAPAQETPAEAPTESQAEEIGSGGSLFDVPAPAEAKTAAPAEEEPPPTEVKAKAAPTEETAASSEATEPATDLGSGGSLFDLAAPEEPAPSSTEPAAPVAEEEAPAAAEESTPTGAEESTPEVTTEEPARAQSIPESGSLFDIATPAPDAGASATGAEEAAESAESPAGDSAQAATGGAALSQAATSAASDDDAAEPVQAEESVQADEGSAEAVDEPAAADPAEDQPSGKSSSSGTSHQPKTDVDINESGSLFDL